MEGGERTFRVGMSGVEWHAVLQLHGRVEGALDVVDGSGHEVQAELGVGVEVVEESWQSVRVGWKRNFGLVGHLPCVSFIP